MEPSLSDSRASVLFPPRGVGADRGGRGQGGQGHKSRVQSDPQTAMTVRECVPKQWVGGKRPVCTPLRPGLRQAEAGVGRWGAHPRGRKCPSPGD
jgi:hypothetical protein